MVGKVNKSAGGGFDASAIPGVANTLADERIPALDRLKLGSDWITDHAGQEKTPGYAMVLDLWQGLLERYEREEDAAGG